MSSDKPFMLRGGDTEQIAIENRINAIDRIKYLAGVDLREKSSTYLKVLDLEMWQRWYKDLPPTKKIDEEFCQRAAVVICDMDGKEIKFNESDYQKSQGEHQQSLGSLNDNEHVKGNAENSGKAEQDASGVCQGSIDGSN